MDLTDSCRLFSVWRESKEDGDVRPSSRSNVPYDHDRRGRVLYSVSTRHLRLLTVL